MSVPGCFVSCGFGLLLYVASFFCLHAIAHCQAEERVELPSLVELSTACAPEATLRRRLLEVDGVPGIWFSEPVAACMASRLSLALELRRLVAAYEERAHAADAQVVLLERQLALSRAIEAQLEEALSRALTRQREAEDRAVRWTRHPALWWTVGMVSSVALQLVALRTVGALGRP